jgi:RHS repeat-associated protein
MMAITPLALAQETKTVWNSYSAYNQDGYSNEKAVQLAIQNTRASSTPADAQWTVLSAKTTESETEYLYGIPSVEIIKGPWHYYYSLPGNANYEDYPEDDQAAVAEIVANFVQSCGSGAIVQVTPTDSWDNARVIARGENGEPQRQVLDYDVQVSSSPNCTGEKFSSSLARERRLECPQRRTWNESQQKCRSVSAAEDNPFSYFSKLVAKSDQCLGNPCDPTTGDKHETATDFKLGWIDFTRHFHSLIGTSTPGFGAGWSHEHAVRVNAAAGSAGSLTVSYIDPQGFQIPFRLQGTSYLASDGSGDVLRQESGEWVLEQADRTLRFDAQGKVLWQRLDSGLQWTYGYTGELLTTIAGPNGRTLQLIYDGDRPSARLTGIASDGAVLVAYGYGANGMLESAGYADGNGVQYHYEDPAFPALLTGVTREDGQRYSTFAYDAAGRAITTTHANGIDQFTLSYPATGGSIATSPLGNVTTYGLVGTTYGRPRQFSGASDAEGQSARTYYPESTDFRRRLDTETDRNGVITKHTYAEVTEGTATLDVHTAQQAQGLPEQRSTVTRTLVDANRVSSIESDARLMSYARNGRLQPTAITTTDLDSNASRTTTIAYCEAADVSASGSTCPILGLVKSVDGPRTDVSDLTQYAYYAIDDAGCATPGTGTCTHRKGDLWKVTNALGQVTETLAYDAAGRDLSVKEANGVVTDYTYSPRGWLISVKVRGTNNGSEADDRITLMEYWPTGQVKKITQPDGAFTAYAYDAAHRLTDVTDNAGNTIHYTLDNAGNRLKEDTKDAGGTLKRTLSRVYNQLGQLVTQADASANPTDFAYDANGNATSATDALARVTQSEYDPLNRLKRTLQNVGGIAAETKFTYDALDRLAEVTDPKGLKTTYTHNGLGDLTQQVSPDTGTTSYTYDSAGNRATQTDARNKTTTYSHDALNRLTGMGYATNALNVTYTYDATQAVCATGETFSVGRLTRMQDGSGTTQYCYDRFGDLTRKVQTSNGVVLELAYAYDPVGRLTGMTYPDGAVVDYVRDAQGRITETGVTAAGSARQVLLTGATYHPFGPVAGWTYGNGRTLTRTLDLDGRPATVHDPDIGGLSVGFGYDEVGRLTELGLPGSTLPQASLAYDALGRLTQFKDGPTGTPIDTYGYDPTGNRTSMTTSTGTTAYTYPATRHRLASVGGIARTFDAAGNTAAIGGTARQFVYDDTGRLNGVKQNGATVRNYRYNGKGERTRGWVGSGNNTYTLYDENGHWLGDYDNAGTAIQQAIWMDDLPIGLQTGSVATLSYIEPDHLGSPRVVIDPVADTAIWKWDLKGEAFGATAPEEDPDGNGVAFTLDLRFPGQRYDAATGLNYNYFRDYEPSTGRYVQSDPIGLGGGVSTYAYVSGNPVTRIDPDGLVAWSVGIFQVTSGKGLGTGGVARFLATSECVNGEMGMAFGNIAFAGGSFDAIPSPISFEGAQSIFKDNRTEIDPSVFNGRYLSLSASLSMGGGITYSGARIGEATSDFGFGGMGGFAAGTSAVMGAAEITSHGKLSCGCGK